MKKMVCLVILLLAAALLTACTEGGEAPVNPGDPSFAGRDADASPSDWPDSVPPADNEGDYDSKITRIYSVDELSHGGWGVQFGTSFRYTLDLVHEKFPIECLRRMDDGRYYAVYQMEEDGLFYAFFDADQFYTHSVYWVPSVDPSKYSHLKGTLTLETIHAYDEAVALIPETSEVLPVLLNCLYFASEDTETLHYTKDGLISICYQPLGGEMYTTDGPVLHKDYAMEYGGYTLDYSVLEKDLPPW